LPEHQQHGASGLDEHAGGYRRSYLTAGWGFHKIDVPEKTTRIPGPTRYQPEAVDGIAAADMPRRTVIIAELARVDNSSRTA
jgi:hypothetical protein